MYKLSLNSKEFLVSVVVTLSLITALFITFSYKLLAVEITLALILVSLIYLTKDFTPILLSILVLRPIVDVWTEYRIGFVGIQMIMTTGVICSILTYLMLKKDAKIKKHILQDPIVIIYAAYLMINLLSIAVNPKVALSDSLSLFFRYASYLAMYIWGFILFHSQKKRDLAIASYIIAALIIACVAYYQYFTGQYHTMRGVHAIQGTFSHPNMYANFIILANLACIYFILQKKHMLLNSVILIANLFLFAQTYSRMALAVWLIVIVILAITYKNKSIYFIPPLAIVLFIVFYNFQSIIDFWSYRFSDIDDPHSVITDRSVIFSALIYWFKQNPLIGIGPSTFCPHYFPYAAPHNELLRNLAEVGLLGTIPFVLIWSIIVKRFLYMSYFIKNNNYNKQNIIIFLMIFAVIVISITSNIGTKPDLLWPLFLLIGGYYRQSIKIDKT